MSDVGWCARVVLLFAQVGLVDMLREEYGITPAGVLGHSAGWSLVTSLNFCTRCCRMQRLSVFSTVQLACRLRLGFASIAREERCNPFSQLLSSPVQHR